MLTLSQKIHRVEESPAIALAATTQRMKGSGIDVVNLTSGEPDFPTPRHIKEAAIIAIEQDASKYTPNQGSSDLIQAIVRKFSRENNLHFEPDQILVSNGAKQCVFNALQAICNKGDEVILVSPHCPDYPEMVKLVDAVPIVVKATSEKKFKPDLRELRRAFNQKTKAILLNSPNNPTGAVYEQSLLEDIAAIVKDTGAYIMSDEVYEKLTYDDAKHFSIGSLKNIRDRVITINGMSMAFAMSGWRIGYMAGPASVIRATMTLQNQQTFSANSIAQRASVAAFSGSTDTLDTMVAEFKRRRDFVTGALSAMPHVTVVAPQGTFFVFFGVKSLYGTTRNNQRIKNSLDMSEYLLQHHHVTTTPGSAFGDDSCLRISFACPMSELEKGMKRLRAGLDAL